MQSLISTLSRYALVLSFFLAPFIGQSQIGSPKKVDSTGRFVPEAIKVVNIIQKVEQANEEIKAVTRRTSSDKDLRRIDSLFPEYAKFISAQKKRKDHFVAANPNRQKINNLIKKWNGYYDHLENWESVINGHEERNIIVQEVLDFNEKTWELTYKNAVDEKVPLEVLNSVRGIWNNYKELNRVISKENNANLILESKINNQKLIVNKVVDDLNALKDSEVYNLFYLRHEPLWKSSFKSPEKNEGEKDEVESISENLDGIGRFVKTSEHSIYLYVLLVTLLLAMVYFAKKAFEKYQFNEENGDLQNAKDVILNNSVISMIFIALIVAKLFFTNTPMLFGNILILLILILSVPLVQPYIYKRFKRIIYFVILFYILDSTKTYMWFSSAQYRV
ncbi:hypothetical protein, partial [Lutimonas sp.]|uniref:hypothetical protein n=1 Tax=Lutimonas sp. TaxID=1872403 RepID=UPI003C718BA4